MGFRYDRNRMLVILILFIIGSLVGFSCDTASQGAITTPDQTKLFNANRVLKTAKYSTPVDTPTLTITPMVLASVTGTSVYLRLGPGMDYEPAGGVIRGQLLLVVGRNADSTWLQVYKEGLYWIKTEYVRLNLDLENVPSMPVFNGTITPPSLSSFQQIPTLTDIPTGTPGPTPTARPTGTPTLTKTSPPPPTATKTSKPSFTPTSTQTLIPSLTPTPTPSPTSTPVPTRRPDAGVTDWLVYENKKVGVREIAWDKMIGSRTPGDGNIFVSLYITAFNTGQDDVVFNALEFRLVDGGGEIHRSFYQSKDPSFNVCLVKTAGICEGWWTAVIRDLPSTRQNMLFYWSLDIGLKSLETPIIY